VLARLALRSSDAPGGSSYSRRLRQPSRLLYVVSRSIPAGESRVILLLKAPGHLIDCGCHGSQSPPKLDNRTLKIPTSSSPLSPFPHRYQPCLSPILAAPVKMVLPFYDYLSLTHSNRNDPAAGHWERIEDLPRTFTYRPAYELVLQAPAATQAYYANLPNPQASYYWPVSCCASISSEPH
jgi:hypothetical protein